MPLDGAGSELRLRLVNGWVWVNDVDTGAAWVTSPQQRLDRVEDWGDILSRLNDDSDDNNSEKTAARSSPRSTRTTRTPRSCSPTRSTRTAPPPPIARDDETQTRVDRPIDVDVLANDTDPNGDVLIVTEVEQTGGTRTSTSTPDGRSVQVVPAAGYAGRAGDVQLHDHRRARRERVGGGAVEVHASGGSDNRPPEAHNDIASTRRGRPTTFDVLANDADPDGDGSSSIAIAIADPTDERPACSCPTLRPGRVHARPQQARRSGSSPTYTVRRLRRHRRWHRDRLGPTARTPATTDAHNDAGVTVVGKPVRLNVLANDTDPDERSAVRPRPAADAGQARRPQAAATLRLTLTPDRGELFFNPDAAGTYVFNYSATDGEETDVAQIRIEVGEPTENRPPIAVRDDVVIPASGTASGVRAGERR